MRELQSMGEASLGAAIARYHRGMRSFRAVLGEEQKEREKGIWKDKQFVIKEAKRVMQENNLETLPGTTVLVRLEESSLAMAITRYHGGFRKFRDDMGQPQLLRENGLWENIRYVLREARAIKAKHGFEQLPGGEALSKLGYSAFLNAVNKYHGGMNNVRRKLGEKLPRTDSMLLRDESYILRQARKIMRQEGFDSLPSWQEIYRRGYASFVNAVNRYHGGIPSIREKLGQEEVKKPKGYWDKFSHVEEVLVDLAKELGHFPTQRDLQRKGHGTIANAITHNHGGMNAVRKRMGFEIVKKDKCYYTNKENIDHELKQIFESHPEFNSLLPSAHWLQKNGYDGLYSGIVECYGSYGKFREQKGLPANLQVKTGQWKDLEFTLAEAEKVMKEHGFENLPGTWTLNKLGYSSLGAAIMKYHGGIVNFRALLERRGIASSEEQRLELLVRRYTEQ